MNVLLLSIKEYSLYDVYDLIFIHHLNDFQSYSIIGIIEKQRHISVKCFRFLFEKYWCSVQWQKKPEKEERQR